MEKICKCRRKWVCRILSGIFTWMIVLETVGCGSSGIPETQSQSPETAVSEAVEATETEDAESEKTEEKEIYSSDVLTTNSINESDDPWQAIKNATDFKSDEWEEFDSIEETEANAGYLLSHPTHFPADYQILGYRSREAVIETLALDRNGNPFVFVCQCGYSDAFMLFTKDFPVCFDGCIDDTGESDTDNVEVGEHGTGEDSVNAINWTNDDIWFLIYSPDAMSRWDMETIAHDLINLNNDLSYEEYQEDGNGKPKSYAHKGEIYEETELVPYVTLLDYSDKQDAEKAAGFTLDVPSLPNGYSIKSYRVVPNQLLQVRAENENGDLFVVYEDINDDHSFVGYGGGTYSDYYIGNSIWLTAHIVKNCALCEYGFFEEKRVNAISWGMGDALYAIYSSAGMSVEEAESFASSVIDAYVTSGKENSGVTPYGELEDELTAYDTFEEAEKAAGIEGICPTAPENVFNENADEPTSISYHYRACPGIIDIVVNSFQDGYPSGNLLFRLGASEKDAVRGDYRNYKWARIVTINGNKIIEKSFSDDNDCVISATWDFDGVSYAYLTQFDTAYEVCIDRETAENIVRSVIE